MKIIKERQYCLVDNIFVYFGVKKINLNDRHETKEDVAQIYIRKSFKLFGLILPKIWETYVYEYEYVTNNEDFLIHYNSDLNNYVMKANKEDLLKIIEVTFNEHSLIKKTRLQKKKRIKDIQVVKKL